jgi:hypothetical protein
MQNWLVRALALGIVALTFAACGGDDKTIDLGDGDEVTVSEDLPDEFPDDFPIYDGADFQNSIRGEQDGIEGIVATWTTGDDIDDVKAFYDDEFAGGPWTSTSSGEAGGSAFWTAEHSDTGKVAYIAISPGDDVTIIATVGDDPDQASSGDDGDDSGDGGDGSSDDADDSGGDGSDDGSGDGSTGSGDATLPDEVDLPAGFPDDEVPLLDDAHVTSANTITSNGITMYTVSFYTKDSAQDVASHYKDDLEGKGYTQSIQTSDGSGIYAAYAENDDGTGWTVIVTASDADVEGYRQVVLQVSGQES